MKEGRDYFLPIKSEKQAKRSIQKRVSDISPGEIDILKRGAILNMFFNVPRPDPELFDIMKKAIKKAFRDIHNLEVDAAWMYIIPEHRLIFIIKARPNRNTK